jgi:hypothetical protein
MYSMLRSRVAAFALCAVFAIFVNSRLVAQAPQNQIPPEAPPADTRDLKPVHPSEDVKPSAPGAVQQSYALVIGIAHYENLPASAQLQFPNRDAAIHLHDADQ